MDHHTPLIAAIVGAIVLAFILGALAQRLRISPLVGYLLAGIAIGPFTPGFVANQALITELAEIGVILLMFGVGLHFSLKDLLAVKSIAVPGAIGQIAVATLLGWGLAALGLDQPALLQGPQQHDRTSDGEGQTEDDAAANVPPHQPGEPHAQKRGAGDLHHGAGNGDGLHGEKVFQ